MKYALILESSPETCNATSSLLASMGYLITPVFSPKKALHAAHMIQFDLIITCTASMPDDRRSLTGELARCAPDAALIYVTDSRSAPDIRRVDAVHAVIKRPLHAQHVEEVLKRQPNTGVRPVSVPTTEERRRRAVG